ncbi:putative membrane protein, partial [Helicobacter pylori Hp H-5b]
FNFLFLRFNIKVLVLVFCFLFLCVLKVFTAYNLSLLFHLVFCLLDFGFLLLMVFASCFLFSLILI